MVTKPQHILDLLPLPQEARVSEDGEAFAEHVRPILQQVERMRAIRSPEKVQG